MDTKLLLRSALFRGMQEDELGAALRCLRAVEKRYGKGETILRAGDRPEKLGMVLFGSVTVESNDVWGNRTILSHIGEMQFFAETYALLPDEPMLVDVTANEDCRVLFLRLGSIAELSKHTEPWAFRLTTNLLTILTRKNLHLSQRSFHTAPKTVRERVMAYLNTVSLQSGSHEFVIPFDRQQMADYLNVERTALSKELGRMQRDGLIQTRKKHFEIT